MSNEELCKEFCLIMDINSTKMDNMDMQKDFYTVKEFAQRCEISEKTIRRSIKKGRICGFRPGSEKGRILIPDTEFQRLGMMNLEEVIDRKAEERKIK